jgi:hypothetical protein
MLENGLNHFPKIKEFFVKRNYFSLIIILHHVQHPNMHKTFSVNPFIAKQTEPYIYIMYMVKIRRSSYEIQSL